jgi:hypothetical protein
MRTLSVEFDLVTVFEVPIFRSILQLSTMKSIQSILAIVASFSVAIVTAQSPLMSRQDSASVLAAAEAAYPICAVSVCTLSLNEC